MSPVAIFIIVAIVVNVITYGGITAMYLTDKRRVEPRRTQHDARTPERSPTALGSRHHDLADPA